MERVFFKGPPVKCPDCGEETVFNSGSLLGELQDDTTVSHTILDRLYCDCFEHDELFCRECEYTSSMLWWINGGIELRGPLCEECFLEFLKGIGGDTHLTEDCRIFWLRDNQKTNDALKEVAEHLAASVEDEEDLGSHVDETLNVLDLF